ncbi:MAG TPA: DUF3352 domain-containing protein [Solirubrobacterales bacterium]|nr:DUF3352 domain-containing protein [Solirubrobacterales bacterium]
MIKTRLALLSVLAAVAAVAAAGCGDSDSSSSDLAGFAPPGSLVYVEGTLQPSGELSADVDSLAQTIAGVDDLGGLIVEELESSAEEDGEPVDFAKEVEPWLGERAGVTFVGLDSDGDLTEPVIAVQSTDAEATQDFIDTQAEQSKEPYEDVSHEGVDFKVGGSEGTAVGLVDDTLLVADDKTAFQSAIEAAGGESLADEAGFEDAIANASKGSLADVYVDVGGLLEQSDNEIDPQAQEALENAGIDPSEATAVASVIPGSDQIQIDVSSDLGGEEAPSGDVSELLGTLPGDSFAALAASGFGDQLKEAIDELDKSGIPGELPPNQLKSTLKAMGIDLDKIADSLEDAAVFAQGNSEATLGGALVLTSSSNEAAKTVANIGTLLRNTQTPGVTAVTSQGVSGFSVRDEELGRKPLVVVAKDDRLAIAYGLPAALQGVASESGETLSENASYKEAVAALGGTPISAFVDGPAALRLAEGVISADEKAELDEARPYLKKIGYIGIGTSTDGDLATAKAIVGVEK